MTTVRIHRDLPHPLSAEHATGLPGDIGSLLPSSEGGAPQAYHVVSVPAGTRTAEPVTLDFTGTRGSDHVLLLVGAGSDIRVVERIAGGGAARKHAVEVVVGDGARAEYVSLQTADEGCELTIRQGAAIGRGGSMTWRLSTLGGARVDHRLRSRCIGDDAESTVDWIAAAVGAERRHLEARNVFGARRGRGEITLKCTAQGKAVVACRGMIEIGLGGGGTDTYLTQSVLMLDPTAKVDAVPGLEIKTNDVKASHSATVARVTPEDLFAFAARGIDIAEARRMFVTGFLEDLTERIVDTALRAEVAEAIERKIAE